MRLKSELAISVGVSFVLTACVQQNGPDVKLGDETNKTIELVESDVDKKVSLDVPFKTVKPGASVTFTHDDIETIEVGENGSVTLTVNEVYPNGTLSLLATGEEGLQIFGAQTQARFDMTDAVTHSWQINYAADRDGRFNINVMATVAMEDGYSEFRAHSVPVKVGDWQAAQAKVQAASDVQILESGEAAVIMEAEETIE